MRLFISFEGGEATGKSLQARLLLGRLQRMGYKCFAASEPGGTRLGEFLRPFIKGETSLTPVSELFLFSASRAQLVHTHIEPKLQEGTIVIVDRYIDSTLAYQGYGYEDTRGRPTLEQIQAMNAIAAKHIMPDLTILLDMDPGEALSRRMLQLSFGSGEESAMTKPRIYDEGQSKFENKAMAFHKRVRDGYLRLARREPERWFVIDARQSIDAIEMTIWNKVKLLIDDKTTDERESQKNLENRRLI